MSEADVNSLLPGYHIDQLREVWGKPDTSENSTACWKLGNSELYKEGAYAKTSITVTAGVQTEIHFATQGSYSSPVQSMMIKLISKDKGAYWISLNNKRLKQYIVKDGWETADNGWYYDLTERTIWVKFTKPLKDTFDLTISKEKFDLIGMTEE